MDVNDRIVIRDPEWIRVDGSVATIGITDFAQSELGDVYTLIFPKSTMRSNKAKSSVR